MTWIICVFSTKHHEAKEKKHPVEDDPVYCTQFWDWGLRLGFFCLRPLLLAYCVLQELPLAWFSQLFKGKAYFSHSRLNLDDKKYELMNKFIRLISVDMSASELLTARLIFGKHDRKEAFVKNGHVGYWNVDFFVNEWFTLNGRLLDGSKFSFSIKEKQQNRSRTLQECQRENKTQNQSKKRRRDFNDGSPQRETLSTAGKIGSRRQPKRYRSPNTQS